MSSRPAATRSFRIQLDETVAQDPKIRELPGADVKTVRSLGFEISRLIAAGNVLVARVKNETLPSVVVPFASMLSPGTRPNGSLDLQVLLHDGGVRLLGTQPTSIPVALFALFRLPALRGFWVRELRRSHFHRLQRVLPRVWFVTGDPPVGAVIPGLNETSWREVDGRLDFERVKIDGTDFAIEMPPTSGTMVRLTYRKTA